MTEYELISWQVFWVYCFNSRTALLLAIEVNCEVLQYTYLVGYDAKDNIKVEFVLGSTTAKRKCGKW